jgi:hypothetical protein
MRNDGSDSSNSSIAGTLKSVTPHLLAVAMLQSVMEGDKPWRTTDVMATSEADDKFPMACEFYQLRIFLDLLTQRFGAGVSGLVEASLISVLDVRGKHSGMDLFTRVMAAKSRALELGPAEDGPDNYKLKMDYQVADQALKTVGESDEEKRIFRPSFAASLTYARIWAEQIFPELVSQIEFDPVSVAFVNVETAYRGLTNRWRENPGCFERHLQRMEGNPLFKKSQRHPSDDDILLARANEDADVNRLKLEVETLFAGIERMGEQGNVKGEVLTDLMQHRIEPLMGRAAALGQIPSAQRHLEALKKVMESALESLPIDPESRQGFRKGWMRQTNLFYAQQSREDTPIESSDSVLALLCERIEDVKTVLEIYRELDPGIVYTMQEMALLHFEMAELEGFKFPGAEEKFALFGGKTKTVPNPGQNKPRPWWRVRGKVPG